VSTLFYDDFNRADGAPGGAWTVDVGTVDIKTNQLRGHTADSRVHCSAPAGGERDFTITMTSGPDMGWGAGTYFALSVRSDLTRANCYLITITSGPLGTAIIQISSVVGGATTPMMNNQQISLVAGPHTYSITMLGGVGQVAIDGAPVVTWDASVVASGTYYHLRFHNVDVTYLDDFGSYSVESSAFYVSPGTVPPGVSGLELDLTGSGTSWTPGNPGSPTFTVSLGTVAAQYVTAFNAASLTYNAPAAAGLATITDPGTGRTCVLNITASPPVLPGGGVTDPGLLGWLRAFNTWITNALNQSALDLVNGITPDLGESILGWVRYIGNPTPYATLAAELHDVLNEVAVDDDDPATLRHILVTALATLYEIQTTPAISLLDVMNAIDAISGSVDLSGVLTAIGGVSDQVTDLATLDGTGWGTPVTSTADLLSAIGGVDADVTAVASDVGTVQQAVNYISTTGDHSIADVLTAVGVGTALNSVLSATIIALTLARGTASAAEIVAFVGTLAGDGSDLLDLVVDILAWMTAHAQPGLPSVVTDLSTVINDIAGVSGDLAADLTTITDAISGAEADLSSQIGGLDSKLDALADAIAALRTGPPTWPGLDGVTLGSPVPITGDMTVAGPLDGVVWAITAYPTASPKYSIGGHDSWRNLGIASFTTDHGDVERFQTVSFDAGVLTPQAIITPAACVLHWVAGVEGTVTPWTVD